VAGAIAIPVIATFWLSTALTELFGSESARLSVKTPAALTSAQLVVPLALASCEETIACRSPPRRRTEASVVGCRSIAATDSQLIESRRVGLPGIGCPAGTSASHA